jgi:hypothetical protein
MSTFVSRLNIPMLRVLKFPFTHAVDLEFLGACAGILSTVKEFILIGPYANTSPHFEQVFGLLHRIQRLDLRLAHRIYFEAFFLASCLGPINGGTEWYACPHLMHLAVRGISIHQLRTMVENRAEVGYGVGPISLESITLYQPNDTASRSLLDWFHTRRIDLHMEA